VGLVDTADEIDGLLAEWEHGPDGIRLVFDCIERAE